VRVIDRFQITKVVPWRSGVQRFQKHVSVSVACLLVAGFCTVNVPFAVGQAVRTQQRFTTGSLPPPQFADSDRARKLAVAFPEVERLFTAWVKQRHMPGAVLGILIDGDLAWVKTAGVRELDTRAPVTPDTVFRIASMTKSFTALAILKLRDEGKLSLDDPIARYVPAAAELPYPTKDSPALTIRHLLTHSEGFPEDNPWGDQQLARSEETMHAWIRAGIPFSNAPGLAYEYSNFGFAILGQVVARASGKQYEDFMVKQILEPLGLSASTFEASKVPNDRKALGYRWEDNTWKNEPALGHGAFGAMGGLWTSARDLARYVAFLVSAFPPRDDPEKGPVQRSSVREMQQVGRTQPASALRRTVDAPLELNVGAYGYGLGVSQSCRFGVSIAHGGGLPGYGSLMRWLPEYGVGLIAMGNLTYASFGELFNDALAALQGTGGLQPRLVVPSPALVSAQKEVSQLVTQWDDALAARIAADNLFLDETAERRAARIRELHGKQGACQPATTIETENALRGKWRMPCERGWLDVAITLAPTMPPRVQYLRVQGVLPPGQEVVKAVETILGLMKGWDGKLAESLAAPGFDVERMKRQVGTASSWGTCKMSDVVSGDGSRESTVKLSCERGTLSLGVSMDPGTHRLTSLELAPTRDQRCVP
jgi:CubicO group peptidase (beta-lactamase class C family)